MCEAGQRLPGACGNMIASLSLGSQRREGLGGLQISGGDGSLLRQLL